MSRPYVHPYLCLCAADKCWAGMEMRPTCGREMLGRNGIASNVRPILLPGTGWPPTSGPLVLGRNKIVH